MARSSSMALASGVYTKAMVSRDSGGNRFCVGCRVGRGSKVGKGGRGGTGGTGYGAGGVARPYRPNRGKSS